MKKVSLKEEMVKNSQLEAYVNYHSKNPNPFIIKEIIENNMNGILELFENLKIKCAEKRKELSS